MESPAQTSEHSALHLGLKNGPLLVHDIQSEAIGSTLGVHSSYDEEPFHV